MFENQEPVNESTPDEHPPESAGDKASDRESDEDRRRYLKSLAEALIFAAVEPLNETQFMVVAGKRARNKLEGLVEELNADYEREERAFEILRVAHGYQFYTRSEYSPALKKLFTERARTRLSRAGLEALAVIAFRGPVTRVEVDEIRGVESGGVLRTLLDRRLIAVKGRADVPGRPLLYETTDEFLKHFGLADLSELPKQHELNREWGEPASLEVPVVELSASPDGHLPESEPLVPDLDTGIVPEDDEHNGHGKLAPVNLGNKPLDTEQ